jgi:hypothetical protein
MSVQRRNSELVGVLKADFQALFDAGYSWKTVINMHLALPGLRGFWPMSSVGHLAASRARDVSVNGHDLGDAGGVVQFGSDQTFIPIADFQGGANDYLTLADAGAGGWADVLGTEAYVKTADRGLTIGGWFYDGTLSGAVEHLIAKEDGGANLQYRLVKDAADLLQFRVWAGPVTVTSAAALNAGWNHCVGIYDNANQDLHVILNGVVASNAGAAPAALPDTGAAFTIGADGAGANLFTGYGSVCFICAAAIDTVVAQSLYWHAAALYGIRT